MLFSLVISHSLCKLCTSLGNLLLLVPEIQPWTTNEQLTMLKNQTQFLFFLVLHIVDLKRETAASILITKTFDIWLFLAVNSLFRLCRLYLCLKDLLLEGKKESLAHLHRSWRSHLFPLQDIPAGQSCRQCGTRDGFIFHCKTAGELFLCTHMGTREAYELERGSAPSTEAGCELSCRESPHQMFPELKSRTTGTELYSNLCTMQPATEICSHKTNGSWLIQVYASFMKLNLNINKELAVCIYGFMNTP